MLVIMITAFYSDICDEQEVLIKELVGYDAASLDTVTSSLIEPMTDFENRVLFLPSFPRNYHERSPVRVKLC